MKLPYPITRFELPTTVARPAAALSEEILLRRAAGQVFRPFVRVRPLKRSA